MSGIPHPPPQRTVDPASPLASLSLCVSGYGDTSTLARVLEDWFDFLGGRPAEVVYVDGGSPTRDVKRLVDLTNAGLITRLETIRPDHWENSFHTCFVQEYRSGFLAASPLLLFIKPDVLPRRRGHNDWLAEDAAKLGEPGVLAITNTHLIDPPVGVEGPYAVHDFASLNFTLMTRTMFDAALRNIAGSFIDANFQGQYPPRITCEPKYRRALIEWCWQEHARERGLRTLARRESLDWMIFHINKSGRKLLRIRAALHRGEGVEPHLNRLKGLYRPPPGGIKRLGQGIENAVRRLKGQGSAAR